MVYRSALASRNRCSDSTGSALWGKALQPFWFLDCDDLILKWLKPLFGKGFSQTILSGGTSTMEQDKKQIEQKLKTFEQKYQISSSEFVTSWIAENLEDQDLEYVEWFSEYRFFTLILVSNSI